jgi:hypothetical protein
VPLALVIFIFPEKEAVSVPDVLRIGSAPVVGSVKVPFIS